MIAWILILFAHLHPFHIAVIDVEEDLDTHTIQLTVRAFADDLDEARGKQDVALYMSTHLWVMVDGQVQKGIYLGNEREDELIWCYFETKPVQKWHSIAVKTDLMTENYEDQQNLVHFKLGEKSSFVLNKEDKTASYSK